MPRWFRPTAGRWAKADTQRRPDRWRRTGCLLLLAIAGHQVWAKEADSFIHRYEILALPAGELDGRPLTDFAPVLDAQVNRIIARVLARRNAENRRGRSCDSRHARKRLLTKLRHALGGPLIVTRNRLRPVINRHPNRVKIPFRRSVYRDFPPWKSPTMALVSRVHDVMADAFRFDLEEEVARPGGRTIRRLTPILVSSDKITHFFNRSQGLFDRLEAGRAADLDRVLAYNQQLEASTWGTKTTGVGSWADLVANFQGMRFWIHLLGIDVDGKPLPDPLSGPGEEGIDPLVRCTAEGWVQAREFTILSYLDPAWDEGFNCSDYRNPVFVAAFKSRIEELEQDDPHGRRYACPLDPDLIRRAAERYGPYAGRLINPEGPRVYRPAP